MSLGTSSVQQVYDAEVAVVILGSQGREVPAETAGGKINLRLVHQVDRPAEHGLDRVLDQRILDRADVLDERRVFFHPTLNHAVELIVVFADDGSHARAVKGQ